jgi:nickel/cobalt exporter
MEYLLMLLSAFGLGAAHALEPGHGKTVVAAYLVGSRGRTIHAVILGAIVTFTHTASIYVLVIASAVAAAYLVPERVEQWFAVGSGVLVMTVGVVMIYLRTKHGMPVHSHSHAAEDGSHHAHPHQSPGGPESGVGLGSLAALGVSGGIVPCPAALLLIPAAVGLGAVLKGLLLVVSFSLGLALVLMGIGIASLKAAGLAGRWLEQGAWTRRISIASAYFITFLGLALIIKALVTHPHAH